MKRAALQELVRALDGLVADEQERATAHALWERLAAQKSRASYELITKHVVRDLEVGRALELARRRQDRA